MVMIAYSRQKEANFKIILFTYQFSLKHVTFEWIKNKHLCINLSLSETYDYFYQGYGTEKKKKRSVCRDSFPTPLWSQPGLAVTNVQDIIHRYDNFVFHTEILEVY
jgi:hypothetical protein